MTSPKGVGRPPGTKKNRATIRTTIDAHNLAWLKSHEDKMSAVLDGLIWAARKMEGEQ